MKTRYQNNCLKITITLVLIAVLAWLFLGCATKPFFKVVPVGDITICVTDDPTRYRPFAEDGDKYLGFTYLENRLIYVRGYQKADGQIIPDYETLGHELSCLMRYEDKQIETLYSEKSLE